MSEAAILWLLGIFVGFIAVLVGIIYANVLKNQDKADDRLQKAKDEAAVQHKDIWDEINKIKDRHHEIDSHHKTLCQRHEDEMEDHRKEIEEHKAEIYKWRHSLTETRSALENKIRQTENSIRVLADIANDLKNGK